MVKVLKITISDRNFIFCFAYFFVRASVHVYSIFSVLYFSSLVDWCYLSVSRWFDSSAISFHQAMKPILSIVYVECRTSRENVDKHTGCKDWENSLFYENINLLLNRIARPLCGHPSKQDVWFSIQSGDPLTTVARSTKSIDIPGYNRSNTRIIRSLKTINNG